MFERVVKSQPITQLNWVECLVNRCLADVSTILNSFVYSMEVNRKMLVGLTDFNVKLSGFFR